MFGEPAALIICGPWVCRLLIPQFDSTGPTTSGFWARLSGQISVRRAWSPPASSSCWHAALRLAAASLYGESICGVHMWM
jgi:hypothetical protein